MGTCQSNRLAALLLILAAAGCGGGGGGSGGTCTSDPAPSITGTPPINATVGTRYQASFEATYTCLIFICDAVDIVQGPRGATVSHDFVYWDPSPDQANKSFTFVISTRPDFCGNTASTSWTVSVFSPPVIRQFSADRTTVVPGESVTLTTVFEGTGTISGIGPVTSGMSVRTGALSSDTNFVLTVRNPVGAELSQAIGVHVLGPPMINSFTATSTTIGAGSTSTLRWGLSGDIGSVKLSPPGIEVTGASSYVVAPAATTVYELLVSNAFASTSSTLEVTVVPPAQISSFVATPSAATPGGSVSLSAQFDADIAFISVEDIYGFYRPLGSIASGGSIDSGPLFRPTRFRVMVSNSFNVTTHDLLVPLVGPGTFNATAGQPASPLRAGHTATRLVDGRVFIAGGANLAFTKSTEIYDPSSNSFSSGPDLLSERIRHTATLLPDGRVLVAGGECPIPRSEACTTTDIYDPSNGTVTAGPLMGGGGAYTGIAEASLGDGRVLLAIALGINDPTPSFSVVIVNPSLGTVSPFISVARPLEWITRAERLSDGRVLLIKVTGTTQAEIFSPDTNSFAVVGATTSYRAFGITSATLQDGRVLVAGGQVLLGTAADLFSPATNSYTAVGSQLVDSGYGAMPFSQAVTLNNGKVLVVGGLDTSGANPLAELFDPNTGTFSVTGGLRTGRANHSATLLQNGRVLILGGCRDLPCDAELYTP